MAPEERERFIFKKRISAFNVRYIAFGRNIIYIYETLVGLTKVASFHKAKELWLSAGKQKTEKQRENNPPAKGALSCTFLYNR